MRASILGSTGTALCQIDSLREGFAALGHEHIADFTHPDSSFVFVGNPPFDGYIQGALPWAKKTIFNVLDIPWHVPEVNDILARLKEHLPLAHRVTAISATVAAQLKEHCGVEAQVIYYPMKAVKHTGERKYPQFKVALVGRLSDPNKFATVAVQALIRAGFNESEVAIVGPERTSWGVRLGVVSDEVLNDIYNSVDYVIMLDRFAGIGLPAIEAACCGAIPIVAAHLQTLEEFWGKSPLGIHYKMLNSADKISSLLRAFESDPTWKAQVKSDIREYGETVFRPLFDRVEVAKRIICVADSIRP